MGRSIFRTWILCLLGGGACGALAVNVLSVAYVVFTVPVGALLATTYGLPVVLAIGIWLSFQRPGPDPRRFVRILQVLGATIAVVVNGFTNVWFLSSAIHGFSGQAVSVWSAAGWTSLAVAFIGGSGFVGWTCGATLAQVHLVDIDHPAAPARTQLRRRRPWR